MTDNFPDSPLQTTKQGVVKTPPPMVQATAGNPLERAGIDAQLAAARAHPRDLETFMARSHSMISLHGVAQECSYALPRAGKTIEGASSRFAEIIVANYGNCRVSGAIVDESADYITARGLFHDLESNMAVSVEVQRRIVDSRGRRYNADMVITTGNAAVSIAVRNATLRGIPKALWVGLYDHARTIIAGGGHDADAIAKAIAFCEKRGVGRERILVFLELDDVSEIMPEHLVKLRGAWQAINDGETTPEEMFKTQAPSAPEAPATKRAKVDKGKSTPKTDAPYVPDEASWLADFAGRCMTITDPTDLGDLAAELQERDGVIGAYAKAEATKALEEAMTRLAI
jgi:hypothetical protein